MTPEIENLLSRCGDLFDDIRSLHARDREEIEKCVRGEVLSAYLELWEKIGEIETKLERRVFKLRGRC